MTKQQVKDAIAVLLTVPVTLVSKLQQAYDLVLDFFTGSNVVDIVPLWTIGATFNTDGSGDGLYCKHADTNGDLRIFETKTDGNIGNEPPTDPLVTENSNWLEISPSSGSAITEWQAGTYGAGLIIVFHNHSVYGPGLAILSEPTRPFNSANIENEITTGKWTWLSVDRSLYQFVHLTDDTDITWNLASRKISTALLDTNETAINLTLQNILQGTHHSLYLRKQQAGDLVITPLFNSLPVFEVGNSVSSSTITLSGAANTLFKIDFARLDVPIGATLLGTTGEAVNFHIVALDENNLVAGMQEFIKKSTNGGLNWSTVETAISASHYFDKLSFAGAVGLASVRGGASLRRSSDSGDSWSSLSPIGPANYQGSVLVIDSSVHYYVNANSHIVKKTIDSGANFTNITIPANTNSWPLHSICKGTSAGTIYVGSNIGRIFKTVDAGANWTVCIIPSVLFSVKVLQFESDLIGYAASDNANLFKTINGGSSWIQVSIPPAIGNIKEIGIVGTSKVIVVGTGGVAYSLDGGALWNLSTDITNIVSCSVVDEENIFLLTSNGNVYKYVVSLTNAVIFVVDAGKSTASGSSQPPSSLTDYYDDDHFQDLENLASKWTTSLVSGTGAAITQNSADLFTGSHTVKGVVSLETGTTNTGRAALQKNQSYSLTDTEERMISTWRARVANLSDGTDTYIVHIGQLSNLPAIGSDPDDGAFFRYTHGVNGGRWEAVTNDNTSLTVTDTGIASDTSYHDFIVDFNRITGEVVFSIDGVVVATHTTNLPVTNTVRHHARIRKSAGTTNRALIIDYFRRRYVRN